MAAKVDAIHREKQRELILALLESYGIPRASVLPLDNPQLLKELEKILVEVIKVL